MPAPSEYSFGVETSGLCFRIFLPSVFPTVSLYVLQKYRADLFLNFQKAMYPWLLPFTIQVF